VANALQVLRRRLAEAGLLGGRRKEVPPWGGVPGLGRWLRALEEALTPLGFVPPGGWVRVVTQADAALAGRIAAYLSRGEARGEVAVEELMRDRTGTPLEAVGFDLAAVPLAVWSSLLLAGVERVMGGAPGSAYLPAWLSLAAANVLGFEVPREALKEWLGQISPNAVSELRDSPYPPLALTPPARSVLLLSPFAHPLWESWLPDRSVAALALSPERANQIAVLWRTRGVPPGLTRPTQQLVLEMPLEAEAEEQLVKGLASLLGARQLPSLPRLHVYATTPADEVRPPLQVAPRSLAELNPPEPLAR
jgi:hypothetical protein